MKHVLLTFLLSLSLTAFAQDFKITHGPYLCDMSDNGVTVVWTTDKPAMSWVEIAPDGEESFYAQERTKVYATMHGRKLATERIHRVRINNLKPGTTYRYRIFSREVTGWAISNWVTYGKLDSSNVYSKEPYRFTTYSDNKEDVSFLVLNDIHNHADFMKDLCKDVKFKTLDFVCFNGDMVNWFDKEESLFSGFLDTSIEMFASETPIVFNRGNHETRGFMAEKISDYFPTRDGKLYQMFSVGKVCFLVLDGGEDKPDSDIEYAETAAYDAYRAEQAEWLKKCVASDEFKNASARVVLLHIPPTEGDWHGNVHLQELFMPILNKANVDVMFSGHTHRYALKKPTDKNSFPIIVNSSNTYLLCKIGDKKIKIDIVGLNAKDNVSLEYPIK